MSEETLVANFHNIFSVTCPKKRYEDVCTRTDLRGNFSFPLLEKVNVPQTKETSSVCVKLTFKSIRPPKFSYSLEAPLKTTVYKIKSLLSEGVVELADLQSFKVMYKSKVLHDEIALEDFLEKNGIPVDTEISFIVAPGPKKEVIEDVAPSISDKTWHDIDRILSADVSDSVKRQEILGGFKRIVKEHL